MKRRLTGRAFVVCACLLPFLGSACTAQVPPPPPPATPSATPTETAQEREERLAYAAAETSYRQFRAEFYKVLGAGGAKSATPPMKATAAGPYLKYFTSLVEAYKGEKSHSTGIERTGYVRPQGYSPTSVILDVCEDSSAVRDFNHAGKQVGKGEIRTARLEIRRLDGTWKIWDGSGKKVASCD